LGYSRTLERRGISGGETALTVFIVLGAILSLAILLATNRAGLTVLLFVAFAAAISAVTSAASGAALLAIGFLYPQAVAVTGLPDLLWLVIPASLSSVVLFDLCLEGPMLRILKFAGMGIAGIRIVEVFAGGVFIALALAVVAHLAPDAGLSPGAALAAGLIGAFVRYFAGLYLDDTAFGDTYFME
jgi:hypothetical protein